MRAIAAIAGALLVVGGLAACSAGPPPVGGPGSASSEEQTAALADDSVSSDEYEEGFRRYQACLADAGYDLLLGDGTGYLVDYSVPDAAVTSGADEACYVREFQQVDISWQLAHVDESETTQFLKDCLAQRGITPGETREEVDKQLEANGLSASDCQ